MCQGSASTTVPSGKVVLTEIDCPGKSVRVIASSGASSAGFIMLHLGEMGMIDSFLVSMTTCFLSWTEMVFLVKSWVTPLSLRLCPL